MNERRRHKRLDIDLPVTKYAIAAYYILVKSEASSNLSRYDGIRYVHSELKTQKSEVKNLIDVYLKSRGEGFGPEAKRSIMMGTYTLSAGYYDAYYKKAAKVRTKIKEEFEAIFKECDVLMAPVSPFPAFKKRPKHTTPPSLIILSKKTAIFSVA